MGSFGLLGNEGADHAARSREQCEQFNFWLAA